MNAEELVRCTNEEYEWALNSDIEGNGERTEGERAHFERSRAMKRETPTCMIEVEGEQLKEMGNSLISKMGGGRVYLHLRSNSTWSRSSSFEGSRTRQVNERDRTWRWLLLESWTRRCFITALFLSCERRTCLCVCVLVRRKRNEWLCVCVSRRAFVRLFLSFSLPFLFLRKWAKDRERDAHTTRD